MQIFAQQMLLQFFVILSQPWPQSFPTVPTVSPHRQAQLKNTSFFPTLFFYSHSRFYPACRCWRRWLSHHSLFPSPIFHQLVSSSLGPPACSHCSPLQFWPQSSFPTAHSPAACFIPSHHLAHQSLFIQTFIQKMLQQLLVILLQFWLGSNPGVGHVDEGDHPIQQADYHGNCKT